MMDPAWSETCWSNFNVWFILEFYVSTTSRFECINRLINDWWQYARWKLEIYSRAWRQVSWLCIKQQVKVKAVLSLYTMKACGGEDVHPHTFLTSALDGRESSATRPCHLQNGMYNCSHDVCRMNKPRRITLAEYVGVGEKRSACRVCVRKSEGRMSLVKV
jgi:hypothetical protein